MDKALFESTTEGDLGKTPGIPFGWMFWTLIIHIKIFLIVLNVKAKNNLCTQNFLSMF